MLWFCHRVYDARGRTLGNGLTQNYTYYAWNQQGGRLQTLSTASLQNFTYQYDAVGNINSISDSINSQTQTFTYDALDRLITAGATGDTSQGGYATETYGYDATTGNLSTKAGVTYTYDVNHKHAVASLSNGNSYSYDANGNMTTRNADSKSYTFAYDAENRLVSVSGDATAAFTFNGDGQRVKSVMDGETTLFVGGHYEVTNPGAGQTVTKYYMAGATRVAVRKGGTLSYMLADHLGSTSLVTDTNGNRTSELRYKPWGETRFSFGTMPTKYTFTGQFSYTDDPSTPQSDGFGLMYYGARWVDVSLGRFTQADTVIPEGPQGYDRYAYSSNDPVNNVDPTGHTDIPWWQIVKFLGGQLIENHTITDADWKTAANTYIPAVNDGSNFTGQVSIGATPLAGVLELNAVTTADGDFQPYFTYGGGPGLGEGVSGGVTQGAINGSGFDSADSFGGQALQLSAGGSVYVGLTGDGWVGLTDDQQLSNVYGYDYGGIFGVGASVALTWQEAVPLGDGFQMNGFGLFVCRVVEQCGSPTVLDEEYYYEYE
ncbi:MAG: hypothetical protein HFACDABA_02753 [Anaerolineales bacterium]|nr:hypothetical protein [Anaerolineales bacterium]